MKADIEEEATVRPADGAALHFRERLRRKRFGRQAETCTLCLTNRDGLLRSVAAIVVAARPCFHIHPEPESG